MYCYDLHKTISGGDEVEHSINFNGALNRTLDSPGAENSVLNNRQNIGDSGHDI